jgi:TolA-binding protein
MSAIKDIHDLITSLQSRVIDRELIPLITQLKSLISLVQTESFEVAHENFDLKKVHLSEVTELNKSHTKEVTELKSEISRLENEVARLNGEIDKKELDHDKVVMKLKERVEQYKKEIANKGGGFSSGVVIS